MQNSINEYILFSFLLIIVAIIGSIIYSLYNKNYRLKSALISLKKVKDKIEESSLKIELENKNLQKELIQLEELKDYKSKYFQLKGALDTIKREVLELKNSLKFANNELNSLQITKSQNSILQENLQDKEQFIKTLEDQLSLKFNNLADKIFDNKQNTFLKSSSAHIKNILEPFNKELNTFRNQVDKINTNQNNSISMLRGELMQIKELNLTLSKEANALTNALKNDSKVQGNWGELILEKALEASGLKEGIEYKREQSFKSDNGLLRADVVIYLPEDKHVVIDSKVSLKSYTQLLKAKNGYEEEELKKRHIISLKRHIETLALKQYHKLNDLKSPEFTLMFMPIEGAYLMALEMDSSIFEYAYERGVTVVTPTTLMTTLKTISTLWKLANHDKNMQKLAIEAGSLHDKFALFLEDFNTIEQRLNQATSAWESAKLKLISGQGNLESKIRKVGELSSKTKKELPKS